MASEIKSITPESSSNQPKTETQIPEPRFRTCELLEALETDDEFDVAWQDFLAYHSDTGVGR